MNKYFQNVLKIIYAFIEQFVFYIAAIAAFLYWVTFDNKYIAISIFILICMIFWAIPSILKRKK